MANQERPWQEFNLNLTELFGPQSSWPNVLTDAVAIARAPLVTLNENVKRVSQASRSAPATDTITLMFNFDDAERLLIVMAFYQYLVLKLQEFIAWPMASYTPDIRTYNMERRLKGIIEFRSACWAAKICATADMTMLRSIENSEQPLPRTLFPRLEMDSRFHHLPHTGIAGGERTPSKVFPYTQPIQSSFESLRGALPTSMSFASLSTQIHNTELEHAQNLPERTSSLMNRQSLFLPKRLHPIAVQPQSSQALQFLPPLESPSQKSPPSLRREPRRIQDLIRKPLRIEENRNIRRDVITSAGLMAKEKRLHEPLRVERRPTTRRPTYEGIKRLFALTEHDSPDAKLPFIVQAGKDKVANGGQRLVEPRSRLETAMYQSTLSAREDAGKHSDEKVPQTIIRRVRRTRGLFYTPLNRPVPVRFSPPPVIDRVSKRLSSTIAEEAANEELRGRNAVHEQYPVSKEHLVDNPWAPLQNEYRENLRRAVEEALPNPKSAPFLLHDGFWY